MPGKLPGSEEAYYSHMLAKISNLKKSGMNTSEIIESLAAYYPFQDIMEFLLGNKYIVKSIITEKLIVVDPHDNYSEKDGIAALVEAIEGIR